MSGCSSRRRSFRAPAPRAPAAATLSSSKHNAHQLACLKKYADFPYEPGTVYCNATYDTFLCWPPTAVGDNVSQSCPPNKLSDVTRMGATRLIVLCSTDFAFRRCGEFGLWLGKRPNESSPVGWTNYTPCFPPFVQSLFDKVSDNDTNDKDAQLKFEIAQGTRNLEIVGFSISLVALIISLVIFSNYRQLRNNRTRIHKSLFTAMIVQVVIRLIVYLDQALIRSKYGEYSDDEDGLLKGIHNMPYVCESSYILLEYAISVMFMWMFIEGLYLHNVVTTNALRDKISHTFYYVIGWGVPLLVTAVWATTTALYFQREQLKICWYGYNFLARYWIMQGPRLGIIIINLFFLLNIMRVLIVKLRRSENTEVEKVRKAVRAALVLLPLLGITNVLNMAESPLEGTALAFGVWSYSTHFLRSFQGFFIAFIYCFLNGEVRQVLKKHYTDYMAMRMYNRRHRQSSFLRFMSSSAENRRHHPDNEDGPFWMRMSLFHWSSQAPACTDNGVVPDAMMESNPETTNNADVQNTNDVELDTLDEAAAYLEVVSKPAADCVTNCTTEMT